MRDAIKLIHCSFKGSTLRLVRPVRENASLSLRFSSFLRTFDDLLVEPCIPEHAKHSVVSSAEIKRRLHRRQNLTNDLGTGLDAFLDSNLLAFSLSSSSSESILGFFLGRFFVTGVVVWITGVGGAGVVSIKIGVGVSGGACLLHVLATDIPFSLRKLN